MLLPVKKTLTLCSLNRLLLAIYLIALLALLMLPIEGPQFRFLNIRTDKWMHFALFGGFAVFLRWNLASNPRAVFISISAAFVLATATEVAQGLIEYRSANLWDLMAGFIGSTLGAVGIQRFMSSTIYSKSDGLIVAILGLMIIGFFALADVIGMGDPKQFGILQMVGVGLGTLIASGGFWVYREAARNKSRP
jgi:VanZ family protein